MREIWFHPLAPAVIFLSGAFILSLWGRRWPLRRQTQLSLVLAGVVFLSLSTRIAFQETAGFFDPPQVLSGWLDNAALTIRIDGMSIAFLFIPALLLLATFWTESALKPAVLLSLGGGAATVFAAANGLALNYAIILFDALACVYWFAYRQPTLAMIRLFLSVLTVSAVTLVGLGVVIPLTGPILAFVLWLRVGLLPFVELAALPKPTPPTATAAHPLRPQTDLMLWFALSTSVGVYIAARFLTTPLPTFVLGLMVVIMLLQGWLAWLTTPEQKQLRLLRMILTQPALALLIAPISPWVSVTMGLTYTLALGVLWFTPPLGRPDLQQRHWLWVYAAPGLATLSLVGLPSTFGWVAHYRAYADLLIRQQTLIIPAVVVAEGIAFSVLVQYWGHLLAHPTQSGRRLWASLGLTMPFLVPGISAILFEAMTGLSISAFGLPPAELTAAVGFTPSVVIALVWVVALAFGWGRERLLAWLNLSPESVEAALSLHWFWPQTRYATDGMSRGVLRLKAIFEGTHYLGWAFLIALAGFLVVVLS